MRDSCVDRRPNVKRHGNNTWRRPVISRSPLILTITFWSREIFKRSNGWVCSIVSVVLVVPLISHKILELECLLNCMRSNAVHYRCRFMTVRYIWTINNDIVQKNISFEDTTLCIKQINKYFKMVFNLDPNFTVDGIDTNSSSAKFSVSTLYKKSCLHFSIAH